MVSHHSCVAAVGPAPTYSMRCRLRARAPRACLCGVRLRAWTERLVALRCIVHESGVSGHRAVVCCCWRTGAIAPIGDRGDTARPWIRDSPLCWSIVRRQGRVCTRTVPATARVVYPTARLTTERQLFSDMSYDWLSSDWLSSSLAPLGVTALATPRPCPRARGQSHRRPPLAARTPIWLAVLLAGPHSTSV